MFIEISLNSQENSQCFFFNKVDTCNFIKKRLWDRCFPLDFAKILRTPVFIERLRGLLLKLFDTEAYLCLCPGPLMGTFWKSSDQIAYSRIINMFL